jgi:hypothetical protein
MTARTDDNDRNGDRAKRDENTVVFNGLVKQLHGKSHRRAYRLGRRLGERGLRQRAAHLVLEVARNFWRPPDIELALAQKPRRSEAVALTAMYLYLVIVAIFVLDVFAQSDPR